MAWPASVWPATYTGADKTDHNATWRAKVYYGLLYMYSRGWEDLDAGECYSQGNWKDLNEFFEYATEWEPCNSLYFGDNILQDVLAPKRFTSTIDSVVVSEEMLAEGIHENDDLIHPNRDLLVSDFWGSYFYYPRTPLTKQIVKASSFRKLSASVIANTANTSASGRNTPGPSGTATAAGLRRVSSLRNSEDLKKPDRPFHRKNSVTVSATMEINQAAAAAVTSGSETEIGPAPMKGPMKINTLWGTLIRDHARMCIPDLECLVEYPLDYKFPVFAWSKKGWCSILKKKKRRVKTSHMYFILGQMTSSGFWPGDPKCLHEETTTNS